MYLVQLLLPTHNNKSELFSESLFVGVRETLTNRFGGLTEYGRAPANGLWDKGEAVVQDNIVVFEIMVEELDRKWWTEFKGTLEKEMEQEKIVVRALEVKHL